MPAAAYMTDMSFDRDAMFFEAVIIPHRSLSRRGRIRLLTAIGFMGTVSATIFFILGAYPVIGFTGLELPFAGWLIHRHALEGRASEVVVIAPSGLQIRRTTRDNKRHVITLPVGWLNVTLRETPGRIPTLLVGSRGDQHEIGRSLGEEEKRDLARAIREALQRWRNPRFDDDDE